MRRHDCGGGAAALPGRFEGRLPAGGHLLPDQRGLSGRFHPDLSHCGTSPPPSFPRSPLPRPPTSRHMTDCCLRIRPSRCSVRQPGKPRPRRRCDCRCAFLPPGGAPAAGGGGGAHGALRRPHGGHLPRHEPGPGGPPVRGAAHLCARLRPCHRYAARNCCPESCPVSCPAAQRSQFAASACGREEGEEGGSGSIQAADRDAAIMAVWCVFTQQH